MKEQRVRFEFEGRYYTLGTSGSDVQSLWFVLHGHGHLARYFLDKFNLLDDGHTLIIAPEGLNRYYLEGFSGKVGSTWMTKEDRLTDIHNYVTFLNKVYKEVLSDEALNPKRITFLGFSQGAATVSRWALDGTSHFDRLILWSGLFPPDMDFEAGNKLLSAKEVITVYGNKDEYLNDQRVKEHLILEEKLGIESRKIQFEGGHVVDEEVLRGLR